MRINFDNIEIPDDKLNAVVAESLDIIQKTYRKKHFFRIAGKAAAVLLVITAVASFCLSSPVMAEKFTQLGEIFGLVQSDQRYSSDYASGSIPLAGTTVSESEDITISLSEFVCTSESFTVSVMIESKNGFPEDFLSNLQQTDSNTGIHLYLAATQNTDFFDSSVDPVEKHYLDLTGDLLDNKTFAGMLHFDFNLYPYVLYEVPDTFHWELQISNIIAPVELGNIGREYTLSGNWTFSTQITRQEDTSSNTIEVNQYGPTGEGISSVTITPYEVTVNYAYNEAAVQPDAEAIGYICLLDADGKYIPDKVGMFSPEGFNLSEITIYYTPVPADKESTETAEQIETLRRADEADGGTQLREYLENTCVYKIEIPLN